MSDYQERFYKKSVLGRDENLFLRVESLEKWRDAFKAGSGSVVQNISNLIYENREIILSSIAGGTTDPTAADFTGVVISPSGQMINGVLYNFALVENGVVLSGLGDDGGVAVITGISIDSLGNLYILAPRSEFISTGEYNIGIGDLVLQALTSGSFNMAAGATALQDLESGDFNTAVGNSALEGLVSGDDNTAVGAGALETASGSGNTAVGRDALKNTQGDGNVALGASAGVNETGSNKLIIDNQDRGAVNEPTHALIYGIFDSDPVNQELHFNANVDVNGTFTVNGSPVSGSGASLAAVRKNISIGF